MRAIAIDGFRGVEHLVIKEIPEPEPKPGHAVIKVMAFGINQCELSAGARKIRNSSRAMARPKTALPSASYVTWALLTPVGKRAATFCLRYFPGQVLPIFC